MKIKSFVLSSIVAFAAAFSLYAGSAPKIVVSPVPRENVRTATVPKIVVSPATREDVGATHAPKIRVTPSRRGDVDGAHASRNAVGAPRRVERGRAYTSKDDVADYIFDFGCLPPNFITKAEARRLGWSGGPLEPYAPGKSIGGDHFGNYENKLPRGRYRECDIDTLRCPRGAKRIIYSDDRRLYYTGDHYRTFQRINRK